MKSAQLSKHGTRAELEATRREARAASRSHQLGLRAPLHRVVKPRLSESIAMTSSLCSVGYSDDGPRGRTDQAMMRPSLHSNHFILEACDRDLRCPIAQTLFHVADIGSLRSILGVVAGEDPELHQTYHPDDEQLAALTARLGVKFDRSLLESSNLVIGLFRWPRLCGAPYLIHTRYELPLLLDGRKKLARMADIYPPMTFDGEDRIRSLGSRRLAAPGRGHRAIRFSRRRTSWSPDGLLHAEG